MIVADPENDVPLPQLEAEQLLRELTPGLYLVGVDPKGSRVVTRYISPHNDPDSFLNRIWRGLAVLAKTVLLLGLSPLWIPLWAIGTMVHRTASRQGAKAQS
jgi:hypothetical protein